MRKISKYLLVTFFALNTAYASGDDGERYNPDFFEHNGKTYCSLSYSVRKLLEKPQQQPSRVQASSVKKDTKKVKRVSDPDKVLTYLLQSYDPLHLEFYNSSLKLSKEMGIPHQRTLTYRVMLLLLPQK